MTWTTGLNNRGEVIGAMTVAGDTGWHPFLWSNGILKDLGTLGADCGKPTSINDAGDIVGDACSPTSFFPVMWRNGVLIPLGLVAGETCGEAYGINSSRQVVGESGVCGSDLPGLGWLWENGFRFWRPLRPWSFDQRPRRDQRRRSTAQRRPSCRSSDPVRRESSRCRGLRLQSCGCNRDVTGPGTTLRSKRN